MCVVTKKVFVETILVVIHLTDLLSVSIQKRKNLYSFVCSCAVSTVFSSRTVYTERTNSHPHGVDVSCSGFMEAGSMRSLGLLPKANSTGILPLRVTCVFLTVAALRINWAGVICDRVVSSRFQEAVSTSAETKTS